MNNYQEIIADKNLRATMESQEKFLHSLKDFNKKLSYNSVFPINSICLMKGKIVQTNNVS